MGGGWGNEMRSFRGRICVTNLITAVSLWRDGIKQPSEGKALTAARCEGCVCVCRSLILTERSIEGDAYLSLLLLG